MVGGEILHVYVFGKPHGALKRTNEELIAQIVRLLGPITLPLITAYGQVVALKF
jgi:hypothetical protein